MALADFGPAVLLVLVDGGCPSTQERHVCILLLVGLIQRRQRVLDEVFVLADLPLSLLHTIWLLLLHHRFDSVEAGKELLVDLHHPRTPL